MSGWSDEETDKPLLCGRSQLLQSREVDEGWREGRADAVRWQRSRKSRKHVKAIKTSAADKVDNPAEDAGAGPMAAMISDEARRLAVNFATSCCGAGLYGSRLQTRLGTVAMCAVTRSKSDRHFRGRTYRKATRCNQH